MNGSRKKQRAPKKAKELPSLEKAQLCAQVAADHKAENPLIYYVAEMVSFTDYFVICSGRSTRHVQGIAEHIQAALGQRRVKPMGIEGLPEGQWVLLDFNDVIVHIFYQPMREFYDLEGFWWEARQIDFSERRGSD
jgi:ribosome-associated protein